MEKLPFYSPGLNRGNAEFETEAFVDVIDLLNDPRLDEEISKGNVTLAMIRPNVGPEANILGLSDLEAAERIEEMVESLGVLAKFSFQFSTEAAEEFYQGGPETSMSKEQPRNPESYTSRWPEFIDFMTSGPTTVLLLHNEDGEAIARWRAHLGHWNIDEVRDMNTIRGKLGVNKYNNLVHGSDAPDAVKRELGIIKRCIGDSLGES